MDVLRASSAGRWAYCPMAPELESKYPSEPSEHTLFGTDTHEMAELILTGKALNGNALVGQQTSEGRLFTSDMVEIAHMYVDYVKSLGMGYWVERDIVIPNTRIAGRCDTAAFNYNEGHLHVVDLKCGYSIVEAFRNLQQIVYAAGSILTLGLVVHTVTITIVQPRAPHQDGPIRSWTVSVDELWQWLEWLKQRAAVVGTERTCVTGPHCDYCDARGHCMAAIQAGFNGIEVTMNYRPENLTPEDLSRLIKIFKRAEKQVKHVLTGVQARVETSITNGQPIPGWTVAPGTGDRRFKNPEAAVAIGRSMGVKMTEEKVVTPAQAERNGFDKKAIETLVERPSTAPKLRESKSAEQMSELFKNG